MNGHMFFRIRRPITFAATVSSYIASISGQEYEHDIRRFNGATIFRNLMFLQ